MLLLFATLPELFLGWIPASAGTTRHGRLDMTIVATGILSVSIKEEP